MTSKEMFLDAIARLDLESEPAIVQMLTGIARSSVFKMMSTESTSKVENIPAAVVNLLRLLVLVKEYDPELFVTWSTLRQCPDDIFYKALADKSLTKKIESLQLLKYDRKTVLREK